MHLALEDPIHFIPRPQRTRLDSHREHVLLIEANETWADVATSCLEQHGYRVTWMRSATEALDALTAPLWSGKACAAELVLMDIDRPALDLCSFMRLLPELSRRAPPVVLLAAQPASDLMQTAEDVGATGFVCKPFSTEDLLLTVRQSLTRRLCS